VNISDLAKDYLTEKMWVVASVTNRLSFAEALTALDYIRGIPFSRVHARRNDRVRDFG
jgi:hypothetical protein